MLPDHQISWFIPREQGGGFQGGLAANDPMVTGAKRDGSKRVLSNGNRLVKSDQHYCLIVGEDGSIPTCCDERGPTAELEVSRRWKTQIAMQKIKNRAGGVGLPTVYATMWKLTVTEESNDKGDWFNYRVSKESLVSNRDLLLEAKAFRESIQSGEV